MGTCPHRALRDGQIPPIQDDDTEVLGKRPPPRPAASCSDCRGDLPVGDSWPGPVSVSRSVAGIGRADGATARILTVGGHCGRDSCSVGAFRPLVRASERRPPRAAFSARSRRPRPLHSGRGRPEYRDRRLAVVLAQGAALHYVDHCHGVKDLDVWTFYAAVPGERFPGDKRETRGLRAVRARSATLRPRGCAQPRGMGSVAAVAGVRGTPPRLPYPRSARGRWGGEPARRHRDPGMA